jgi:imidazolonepropionase-like amidohydrolase
MPARDFEPYDVHYKAPEILRQAGVKVIFSIGAGGKEPSEDPSAVRNLPYAAALAVAFGLPAEEALKGITLYPAQIMGVDDRLGSIETGKDATLFACDGDILDLRANVKHVWIAGHEVSLETRHTRLYDKYRNRPKP